MTTPSWGVDSYHVNIGNGDCSIHVLVHLATNSALSCVLIDGGSTMTSLNPGTNITDPNPIRRTADFLTTRYVWSQNRCQFNTIIISHWDEDHYGGLLRTIVEDAAKNNGIITYLKYTSDGSGNLVPATVLYTPNWFSGTRLNGAPVGYIGQLNGFGFINTSWRGKTWTTDYTWVHFCKVQTVDPGVPGSAWNEVLGAEFFKNSKCANIDHVNNLDDLVTNNPPVNPNPGDTLPPQMYCVAVRQQVPGPATVGVIVEDPTITNRVSIACIIYWPDTRRISHYLAGDADQDTESKIITWIQKKHSGEMTSMKVSHHGSRSSTPLNMVDVAMPYNIILSNPSARHTHPSWEVMFFLFLWTRAWSIHTGHQPRVLATKYPHFFALEPTNAPNVFTYKKPYSVNLKSFQGANSDPYKPFWDHIREIYAFINQKLFPPGQGLLDELQLYSLEVHRGRSEFQLRYWALDQLVSRWDELCHPPAICHPAYGLGYAYPGMQNLTVNNSIESVVIFCRNDNTDGSVSHKFYNAANLVQYDRWTNTNVFPVQQTATVANAAAGMMPYFTPNYAPGPSPPLAKVGGGDGDPLYFYSQTGAVITGDYDDEPGTDPNEDEDIDMGIETISFRAILGGLGPLPPKPPLLEETGYYFYASRIPKDSIKVAATQYTLLSGGTAVDTFVGALHCGVICLPGPNPPPTSGTTALLDSDEFGTYMSKGVLTEDLSIYNAAGPSIDGFSFAMTSSSIAAQARASGKGKAGEPSSAAAGGTPLYFTTNAVKDAFNVTTPPPQGVLKDVNILVFGLDTSAWTGPETTTLLDLVKFAGITYLEQSPAVIFMKNMSLNLTKDKTTGRRNAAWFEPLKSYRATIRLEYDLDDVTLLNNYLAVLKGISIVNAFIIARKVSTWGPGSSDGGTTPGASINYDGSLAFGAGFQISGITFETIVELHPTQVKLELVLETKVDALQAIFEFLKPLLSLEGSQFVFVDWLKETAGNTSFDLPSLRRIVIVMNNDSSSVGGNGPASSPTSTPGISSVTIDLETRVNFNPNVFALFLMTYHWERGQGSTLEAKLWCAPGGGLEVASERTMLPDYEEYNLLKPVTLLPQDTWPSFLDISKIGGFDGLPKEIPNEVTQASLSVGSGGIAFTGTMVCDPKAGGGAVPRIYLGQLYLNVSYLFGKSTTDAALGMTAMISPGPGAKNGTPAQIQGEIALDNGTWKLNALVTGVYGSTLYQFFDSSSQGAVVSILDNIEIQTLGIEYDYAPGGAPSSFFINGILMLGSLQLTIDFTYKDDWTFLANLYIGTEDPAPTTIGAIAGHIFGSDITLPDFVADIPVKPPKTKDAVGVDITSTKPADSPDKSLLFTAWLDFLGLSFQAIQYQAATPKGGDARPPVQRAFAVSINQLPEIDIPLVGNLTQPFDEMLFLYVQPQSGKGANLGLTYADVTAINTEMDLRQRKRIPYKVTKKQYEPTDVVLSAGAHFILVLKNDKGETTVALDYVFDKPPPPTSSDSKALVRAGDPASPPDPGSAKAPYEKKIGPVTIRNMGLKYSAGPPPTLSILMDASIVLGPIGLGLIGFSLDITFPKGASLHDLPKPGFSLSGLAVSFDRAPLILAGMFEHIVKDDPGPPPTTIDFYEGAVTLSFVPYLFEAAGYYGTTTSAAGSFVSTFVYFILNGPLVTLELAEIDGITGGFGYNTNLQFPNAANVLQFPFIDVPDSKDPNSALATLTNGGWFYPQDGSFWLAAGLTVTALEVLSVKAVVVVQWDPRVKLGIFGVATADIPAGAADSVKLAHVELGIAAVIDFNAGTLKIDGQLTPASFILDPNCHLTGGFALYSWYASNDPNLRGDWVFTIGGYHQSYQPPTQYPNPPRLAISWSYDSSISISGQAYFAVTPKVCMGGGRLDVSLSLGPLYAFFDAYADFLINYKPFHFMADGGLSIGVKFTLDLWICTIHISIEIGATLYLQGPPIAGTVHVDFWVFGFDVDFGDLQGASIDPLSLEDFYNLVLQSDLPRALSAPKAIARTASTPALAAALDAAPPLPHVFSCNNGLIPSGNDTSTPGSGDQPWNVRGAVFQFTVASKFAIDSATIITGQLDTSKPPIPPLPVPGNGNPIYAKPMQQVNPLSSVLTVTITPVKPERKTVAAKDVDPKIPRWDTASVVVKSVPTALWGIYDPKTDPSSPSNRDPNHIPNLLNGADPSTPLPMSVVISSPSPVLSGDIIPPFPYKTFFTGDAGINPFPAIPLADPAWYPTAEDPEEDEWEVVRGLWSGTPGLGQGAGEKAVELWAGLSFEKWDIGGVGSVSGEVPAKLVTDGVFQTLFLEAPRVGVAMA